MTAGKLLGARLIGRILALLAPIQVSPSSQHMTLPMTTLGLTGYKGQAMSKFDEILNKGQGLSYWLLFAALALAFYGGLWLLMILLTLLEG